MSCLVIVVRGGSGTGKTIATAQWAAGCGRDVVWITVSVRTADRVGFWVEVIRRLTFAGLLPMDASIEVPVTEDRGRLRVLVHERLSRLGRTTYLVIDDAHLICDDRLEADLSELAGQTPLRLVIVTHSLTPFDSHRMRLALAPVFIDAEQLMFNRDEIAAMVRVDAGADVVAQVARATRGVPVLVRAAALATAQGGGEHSAPSGSYTSFVETVSTLLYEYLFAGEPILGDLDFVFRIVVADPVPVSLAKLLSHRDDAQSLLDQMVHRGVGTWYPDTPGGEAAFSFPPVLRELLLKEAQARMPDEVNQLHRLCVRWYADRDDPITALEHAVAAGDIEQAGRVVVRGWYRLLMLDMDAMGRALESLPVRDLMRDPALTFVLGVYYNSHRKHRSKGLRMFALTETIIRLRPQRDTAQQLLLTAAESIVLRLLGRSNAAVSAADRALKMVDDLPGSELDLVRADLDDVLANLGVSYQAAGRWRQAIVLFERAWGYRWKGRPASRVQSAALLAGALAVAGELATARAWIAAARAEEGFADWRDGYIAAGYWIAEALVALDEGDMTSAEAHLAQLDRHRLTIEFWPLILEIEGLIRLGAGVPLEGAAILENALANGSYPATTPQYRARLEATWALLEVAGGRPWQAQRILGRRRATTPQIAVARARMHLATGAPERALEELASLDEKHLTVRSQAEAGLLRAAAALGLGHHAIARDALAAAIGVMVENGLRHPLSLVPTNDDVDLLSWGSEQGGLLGDEIRRLRLDVASIPAASSMPSLTTREGELLRLLAAGLSRADIAGQLVVSENTVKTELGRLYRKLGVHGRREAIVVAKARNLLDRL